MENQQLPKKEDFKIVSRPSNEEIDEVEEGHCQIKAERYEEQGVTRLNEDGIVDEDLGKVEDNNEPLDRLEDK